ncbi:unnamed protein product [Leuciscus chuanchicus]
MLGCCEWLPVNSVLFARYSFQTGENAGTVFLDLTAGCNTRLQHQPFPTYLGVKLDRTLSFRQHLDTVKAKTTSRAALIWRLAGTTWGASTKMLLISTRPWCSQVLNTVLRPGAVAPMSLSWTLPLTPPYGLSPDAYEPLQPTNCPSLEELPLHRSGENGNAGSRSRGTGE